MAAVISSDAAGGTDLRSALTEIHDTAAARAAVAATAVPGTSSRELAGVRSKETGSGCGCSRGGGR